MKVPWRGHRPDGELLAFAEGSLGSGPASEVAAHVAGCTACRARVQEYSAVRALIAGPPSEVPPSKVSHLIAAMRQAPVSADPAESSGHGPGKGMARMMYHESALSPSSGGEPITRRSLLRQGALAVAGAALLGGMAGVWVTRSRTPASDTAYPYYENALAAYRAGKAPEAVAFVLQGTLAHLETGRLDGAGMAKFATMRELARRNGDYALSLATAGSKAEALNVNELTAGMADQLLESGNLISDLVAEAIYALWSARKADILAAAGDADGAAAQRGRHNANIDVFRQRIKPQIDNLIAAERAHPGVSVDESVVARAIAQLWRRNVVR